MIARLRRARRSSASARSQRGAAAVEFALVLPPLVMLLFGITTAGLSYTHAIGLSNAVREGSRFGATADPSSGTWANDVIAQVRQNQFDDSTSAATSTTAVCVQLIKIPVANPTPPAGTSGCSSSSSPSLTAPNAPPLDLASAPSTSGLAPGCVVEVWAARDFTVSVIIFPAMTGTSTPASVALSERGVC